ncbi:hypothetical protein ACJMK2_028998 [Sinanodonta woodiana]|uniref:Uncharacterized protein n=1 Tax=Sinanodonta woodiana TaxID=1069815 RepID=A0ABD3X8U6_SINWO
MRCNRDTENGHVAQMQDFMTGKESFIYGRSAFWIDTLGMLKEVGQFTRDFIDISLIQFCLIQWVFSTVEMPINNRFICRMTSIDSMVQVWNVHRIRPTKNQNFLNSRPVVMYKLPMIYGTRSYLQSVDAHILL